MDFVDRELPCRDCGRLFVWTAGEQHFFHEKALSNIPVRCSACRSARKARMGLQDRAQTEVVCAECGTKTTVPFIPRNGNPVYCSRCFDRHKAGEAASVVAATS
jgi:CxxC-x17-CxxC domain-containing protein